MTVNFNIYVRENISDPKTTLATGLTSPSYSVSGLIKGKKYLFSVGAEKNSVEKVGDEKVMLFGEAWTPTDLTNPPKIWLSSESVIKDSSNRISRVTDVSGNNNHFVQSNVSKQPILADNSIRFDGIDDVLTCENLALFKNTSDAWVFAVYKKRTSSNTDAGGQCVFYVAAGANTSESNRFNLLAKRYSSAKPAFAARTLLNDAAAVVESSIVNDTQFLLAYAEAKYSAGTTKLVVNAMQQGVGAITVSNTSNNDAPSVNFGAGNNGAYADTDVLGLIVGTGSTPTLAEIQKLEGWAAHKYGLTNNLPANHPYKTLVPTM